MHEHVWVTCYGRRVLTILVIDHYMFQCDCQFCEKIMVLGSNCHYKYIGIDCMFCSMLFGMV